MLKCLHFMKVDQNKGWEDNKAENPDPVKWMWMVLVLVSVLKRRYRHWHCIKTFGMELSHKSDTKIRAALTLERCCVVQTASFRGDTLVPVTQRGLRQPQTQRASVFRSRKRRNIRSSIKLHIHSSVKNTINPPARQNSRRTEGGR